MQGKEFRKYTIEDYDKIINLRKSGLSLRNITKRTKISNATIWHWSMSKRKPRMIYAKRLEENLELSKISMIK